MKLSSNITKKIAIEFIIIVSWIVFYALVVTIFFPNHVINSDMILGATIRFLVFLYLVRIIIWLIKKFIKKK